MTAIVITAKRRERSRARARTPRPSSQAQPQPPVTVADAPKPAVRASSASAELRLGRQLISAAVSVALVLFFALAGDIGAQGRRGVVAPAQSNKVAAHLSPPGQRRNVPTAQISQSQKAKGKGQKSIPEAVAVAAILGVYGVNNLVSAKATPQLRAQAATAWRQSARGDITGGATHWGNAADVRHNRFYSRLHFTVKIGDHYFFRA